MIAFEARLNRTKCGIEVGLAREAPVAATGGLLASRLPGLVSTTGRDVEFVATKTSRSIRADSNRCCRR